MTPRLIRRLSCLFTACLALAPFAQGESVQVFRDIQFAEVDGKELRLDLHMPKGVKQPPLVVYIHGGGWRSGSRARTGHYGKLLTDAGFAVASISYRLSSEAKFPAQIHDIKGAVRWLRAHAGKYGYDSTKIGVFGGSAGAHLGLLLGATADHKELEGDVGGNLGQSSRVTAVVDFFGPTDFVLRDKDQPQETDKPSGKVYQLIGGPVGQNRKLAELASPAFHLDAEDAAVLVFHGTNDRTVLINQSERLRDAAQQAGMSLELVVVDGGGHGSAAVPNTFLRPEHDKKLIDFLRHHLKERPPGS